MKRSFALIVALAMLTALLASCNSPAPSASTAPVESGSTSAPSKPQASGEDITLRVSLWDYSNVNYFKTIFASFEESHPGIKVEAVESSAAEYDDLIQVKMSSKENFDVVFTKGTPALSALISKGHMLPLDDLMANDPSFDAGKYSGLVEQMELDGQIYGVPFRKDNNLLFYNKDLFDAANVEYPKDGMTMDEFSALAEKMTSGTGNDKVYGAHIHTWSSNVSGLARRTEEWSYLDEKMDALIPYYESIIGMMDAGTIMDYGELKATSTHYSGVFYNQQTAMLPIGTWFINMLLENADFNWGVCASPNVPGIGNTVAQGGITPVSIGAYSEHPNEAWELIKYITGEEGAVILANAGILPGYSSDAINDIFDGMSDNNEFSPEGLSAYIDLETYIVGEPMSAQGRERIKIIDEEHDLIMTKSIGIEDGIAEMNQRLGEL